MVRRCTRLLRLSHTFFWAATPTCSNGLGDGGQQDDDEKDELVSRSDRLEYGNSRDAIGPLLLSPMGLERLVAAGEMTADEVASLLAAGLPPSQYAYVLLEWSGMYATRAMQAGTLIGGAGYEKSLLEQFTRLRAEYFNIGDYTAGRMPLAYVQLVQVLYLPWIYYSLWLYLLVFVQMLVDSWLYTTCHGHGDYYCYTCHGLCRCWSTRW